MTMKNSLQIFLILAASAALSACAPTVNARGNMVKDYQMVTLHPGTSTKTDVLKAMGSPTTQDPFDENIWYYMGQVTEKKGIFDPKVTDERIVQVAFDETGLVKSIQDVGGHRDEIPYERSKTKTSGNEVTLMQQFFGNLGRFNKEGDGASPTVGSPGR